MRYFIIIATILSLVGCAIEAETASNVGVGFNVQTLFTNDGCTVYRFYDAGSYRYYTSCKGSAEWRETCGKNCTRNVEIGGGK